MISAVIPSKLGFSKIYHDSFGRNEGLIHLLLTVAAAYQNVIDG